MAGSPSRGKTTTTSMLDFFLDRENVHKLELKLSAYCWMPRDSHQRSPPGWDRGRGGEVVGHRTHGLGERHIWSRSCPKILQFLSAPMKTAGLQYHWCTGTTVVSVSTWVWFMEMLKVKVPTSLPACFCSLAAFQKKSTEGWTASMLFSFPLCKWAALQCGRGSVHFSGVVATGSGSPGSCLAPTFVLPPVLHLSASAVKVAVWPCN